MRVTPRFVDASALGRQGQLPCYVHAVTTSQVGLSAEHDRLTGVSLDHKCHLVELVLGSDIDEAVASRVKADAQIWSDTPAAKRVLIDARRKSFTSIKAQRSLSREHWGNGRPAQVDAIALWVPDEVLHYEIAPDYGNVACFTDPTQPPAPSWVQQWHEESRRAVHLVAGSTGAGKSTYASRLAANIGGVVFAIDDWMHRLFRPDHPADATFEWYMERILRCEAQIWSLCIECNRRQTPTILDLGLTDREHRARFVKLAASANVPMRLHFVDVPPQRRWKRVEQRNHERGETFRFAVTRDNFDFVEQRFEAPSTNEGVPLVHWRG